ncbi:MAG: hypothetical protein AAF581_07720 [Planctomycetota bacterium]
MADLHQIIGGLFRDLSKARFAADLYSRDISRYYEQSPLLRQFPVPRTEIDEVEIDLKFFVSGVARETVQNEGRDATLAVLFERHSLAVESRVMGGVEKLVERLLAAREESPSLFGVRINLRRAALRYWIQNSKNVISSDGEVNRSDALAGLKSAISSMLLKVLKEPDRRVEATLDKLFTGDDEESVAHEVDLLAKSVAAIWRQQEEARVAVEVDADRLSRLDSSVISSIKVKAHVRNYQWTEVQPEDDVGESWFTLNAE